MPKTFLNTSARSPVAHSPGFGVQFLKDFHQRTQVSLRVLGTHAEFGQGLLRPGHVLHLLVQLIQFRPGCSGQIGQGLLGHLRGRGQAQQGRAQSRARLRALNAHVAEQPGGGSGVLNGQAHG